MNKDIRLSIGFFDHWKTVVLKQSLGNDAVESLIRLWCFSAQNKPDGVLIGMPENAIEIACKWNGERGALIAALFELRFIERNEQGTICLHDWIEHNGYAAHAKERHEQAVKASEARWKGKGKQSDKNNNAVSNADSIPVSNAPSPIPYPSPIPFPKQKERSGKKSKNAENYKNADFSNYDASLRSAGLPFGKIENNKKSPPKHSGLPNNWYMNPANEFDRFWDSVPENLQDEKEACRQMWKRHDLDSVADTIIADIQERPNKDYRWKSGKITPDTNIKWYLNDRKWQNRIIEKNPKKKSIMQMSYDEIHAIPF